MESIAKKSLILKIILLWFSVSISEASANQNIKNQSAIKYKDQSIFKILQVSKVVPLKLSGKIEDQIAKSKDDHAIVFFASWCQVCLAEIALFQQKVRSGKCSRISFISVDEDKTKLDAYLMKIPKMDANIFWDEGLVFSKAFGVDRLPAVVYLDGNKTVQRFQFGGSRTSNLIGMMVATADGRQGGPCE